MKIWGRVNSINVMKVLWAADECGVAYERVDVGMAFGGNDQPWYLKMNPNGVVPTIEDGGRVIREAEFPGRQGRLLFAYLACRRHRPVSRDEIAAALWPDALPTSWDSSLNALVSKLRGLLRGLTEIGRAHV